ncbi:hemerythrin domain-containing protein [Arenibaculum pallidiluteum]|uniref:hemerythrin domain-containing protein n=1 Tax=Arenibaculum pallidiluteum TaxID=2812559 RepID=UPI001A9656C8|nr:hemerythrin domain-containing protein [Arenibaculum pallidiluteum]
MTVVEVIVDDHRAAREMYAEAGNAPQQANSERADKVAQLGALWRAHNAMMSEVVYPALQAVDAELARSARERQDEVAMRLAALASGAGAEAGLAGDWLADFERFKAVLEEQCRIEDTQVVAAIRNALPPDETARLTRAALDLRRAQGI